MWLWLCRLVGHEEVPPVVEKLLRMRVESELLFLSCSGPMYLSVPIKEETWRDRLCSPLSRDDTVGAALIVPPVAAAAKAFHGRARPERPHPPIRAHHGALAFGADRPHHTTPDASVQCVADGTQWSTLGAPERRASAGVRLCVPQRALFRSTFCDRQLFIK